MATFGSTYKEIEKKKSRSCATHSTFNISLLLNVIFSPTKAELRKAQGLATAARADAQMKTNIAEAKKKYVKSLPVECNN